MLAFLAAQCVAGDGFGESQAVLLRDPRQGHQAAHHRLRGEDALSDLLLHGLGNLTDQRQAARDPARALVQAPGQLVDTQTLPRAQLDQEPALLQGRQVVRVALRAVEQERVRLIQVPNDRPDRVVSQAVQGPQPLEAVDDQVAVRLALRDDHDRDQLTLLGQRRQQTAFPIRTT